MSQSLSLGLLGKQFQWTQQSQWIQQFQWIQQSEWSQKSQFEYSELSHLPIFASLLFLKEAQI